MANILITGATGLIGSHLLPLIKGNEVYLLTRRMNTKTTEDNFHLVSVDLSSDWSDSSLPKGIDTIIQLSQSEHFRKFPEKAEDIFRVNTLTTFKLLEYARKTGVKSYVYASSAGIYGIADGETSEDVELRVQKDLGFYLGTKLSSEIFMENYAPFLNIVILRPFFVYGPGQKDGMLVPRLVSNIMNKKPILLNGSVGISITPTFVSDAAAAVEAASRLKGFHKINLAGPEVLTIKSMGLTIGRLLGVEPVFKQLKATGKDLIGSIDKMSRLLHKPVITFEAGVANYLESLKK